MFPPTYHHNGFVATHATVHQVPNCMSCRKAIVMITEKAHSFHEYTDIIYNITVTMKTDPSYEYF